MTITLDAPSTERAEGSALSPARFDALSLAHAALALSALCASALLATWGRLVAPASPGASLAMLRTHGATALLFALPLVPAMLSGGAILDDVAPRRFARARVFALLAHGASVVCAVLAAHGGGTSYGAQMPMAFSAAHASDSVLWLLAAFLWAAVSAGASSLVSLASLHSGPSSAWTSPDPLRWSAYVAGFVTALSAPVTVLWALFAAAERTVGSGMFDPALGGHPLRFSLLRSFWTQSSLVASLLVALGVLGRELWLAAGAPDERRVSPRAAVVSLGALAPLGLSPVESLWHDSAVVVAQRSLLALFFYAPLLVLARDWLRLLRRASERSAGTVSASGALALVAVGAPAGVALAVPSLTAWLALTPFASGLEHTLVVGACAHALVALVARANGLSARRAMMALSAGLTLSIAAAFVPMLLAGARGEVALRGATAWVSGMGSAATLSILCAAGIFAARARLARRASAG